MLKYRTFYSWYVEKQNECLPELRGFHLQNTQPSVMLEIVEENTTTACSTSSM
jgi:hypothetical protein